MLWIFVPVPVIPCEGWTIKPWDNSAKNRDTSYGRRMSLPPTSCGERRKTCAAPPNSWQHVGWGSKHGWSTAEEEEQKILMSLYVSLLDPQQTQTRQKESKSKANWKWCGIQLIDPMKKSKRKREETSHREAKRISRSHLCAAWAQEHERLEKILGCISAHHETRLPENTGTNYSQWPAWIINASIKAHNLYQKSLSWPANREPHDLLLSEERPVTVGIVVQPAGGLNTKTVEPTK